MRSAILFLMLLFIFPRLAFSECWEMIQRNGDTIVAKSIWGLSDRLGGGRAILGKFDNKDVTMPVDDIQSIVFGEPRKGWRGWLQKSAARGSMTLTSGKVGEFETSQIIQYIRDTEQQEISPDSLISLKRCSHQLVEQTDVNVATEDQDAAAAVRSGVEGVDQVKMKNGDVLTGAIATAVFDWKSEYELLKIPQENILRIETREGDGKSGILYLRSGGRITGMLVNTGVSIRLSYGQDITVPADKVREIGFKTQ